MVSLIIDEMVEYRIKNSSFQKETMEKYGKSKSCELHMHVACFSYTGRCKQQYEKVDYGY